MRTTAIVLIGALSFGSCNAQEGKKEPAEKKTEQDQAWSNQPKVSWDVKKELDDKGNIIRYDSTYTWSYSNMQGEPITVDADSVMRSFYQHFDRQFPSIWGRDLMNPFWDDTQMQRDFFRNDFFHDRWKNELFDLENMFHRMDSIRNDFFQRSYPGLIQPPDSGNDPKERSM